MAISRATLERVEQSMREREAAYMAKLCNLPQGGLRKPAK
jgi:hypothetical protein